MTLPFANALAAAHRNALSGNLMAEVIRTLAHQDHLHADDMIRLAGLLTKLDIHDPNPEIVLASAQALRETALGSGYRSAYTNAVDLVGTGGDNANGYNISTTSALAVAACGISVAKHGNRKISSSSGAADLIEALKIPLSGPEDLKTVQPFTFLFAPLFHPAAKTIAPVRRALGFATLFNILGPLANPVAPPVGLYGCNTTQVANTMAATLSQLQTRRAWVVCNREGLDELAPCGETDVIEIDAHSRSLTVRTVNAETFGLPPCSVNHLTEIDPQNALKTSLAVLQGEDEHTPLASAVLMNAGAILWLHGDTTTLKDGAHQVRTALRNGKGRELLRVLAKPSSDDINPQQ